jgi:hypothetical protein
MPDILGPASAANSVTTDPGESRSFGGTDSWFKDCSNPAAVDGTALQAAFLNGLLRQFRSAIRDAGVTEDNAATMLRDTFRARVAKAGDTMTGLLTLSADPTVALHAATKAYVDAAVALRLALAGGTMTGLLTLSGAPTNALHAATKTYVDTADALRLALAGGTMTGALTLSGDPTAALHAATKQYVDYYRQADVILRDERTTGTAGGTGVAPPARTTLPLNTTAKNRGSMTTLTANQFTLPAGTFKIQAFSSGNDAAAGKMFLRNVTDSADLLQGPHGGAFGILGFLSGEFTLAATKTLRLEAVINGGGDGSAELGQPYSGTGTEVYRHLEITRIA